MNKKILTILIFVIAVLGICCTYLFSGKSSTDNKEHLKTDQTISNSKQIKSNKTNAKIRKVKQIQKINEVKKEKEQFTTFIDMKKWQHNAKDGVYYQLGIFYTQTPVDLKYQKLALFVPEKYLKCENNGNKTFSCVHDMTARVEKFDVRIAPIVFEINSPDFASTPALTEYRDYTKYTNKGLIYAHIGFRGIEAGAPYGVTDIKAAIRYLHKNNQVLPGNTDSLFILGANHGAALAAIIGASGNDKTYTPYLQEIGALKGVDDTVFGVMLINPISGLDTANEAIEWMLGGSRKDMSSEQKKLSEKMAKEYANYINRAGIISPQGQALTLQYSENGMYQQGTYYDYIKGTIAASLEKFLHDTTFPTIIPKSWEISEDTANEQDNIVLTGTAQTKEKFLRNLNAKKLWVIDRGVLGLKISSLADFNNIFKRNIPAIASIDGLNKKQKANTLFGRGNGEKLRFDFYTARVLKSLSSENDYSADLYKQDKTGAITLKRANLYNPLYYLLSSYDGYNSTTVAPYWYIRNGLFQNKDVLTTAVNLTLALSNYKGVKPVNYQAVWGMGDIDDLSEQNRNEFINWITNMYK